MSKAKFKSQEKPGFSMTFENGWTISVQFHAFAYCERRQLGQAEDKSPVESPDAEIAIWNSEGDWYNFGSDEVLGYQTPDEVADWITKVKAF